MFFYHWHFNEEERRKMFKKIEPNPCNCPALIRGTESLRGWFESIYDKFTGWIWARVMLYGKMYRSSKEGRRWESEFNRAR